jgi:hypothetical protein
VEEHAEALARLFWTIWQTPIVPIVDFDVDEKLDLVDPAMLIDNLGTDKTLYDIGPFAWGDGEADIQDLKVVIAEWEKQTRPRTNSAGTANLPFTFYMLPRAEGKV